MVNRKTAGGVCVCLGGGGGGGGGVDGGGGGEGGGGGVVELKPVLLVSILNVFGLIQCSITKNFHNCNSYGTNEIDIF